MIQIKMIQIKMIQIKNHKITKSQNTIHFFSFKIELIICKFSEHKFQLENSFQMDLRNAILLYLNETVK